MDEREFRALGHDIVDRLADYLESVEQKSLDPHAEPAELEGLFDEPLSLDGISATELLRELETKLFPNCTHVKSSRRLRAHYTLAGTHRNIGRPHRLGPQPERRRL